MVSQITLLGGLEFSKHTWILAVQSEVMAVILEPETPGGFKLSMDCRIESSSATAEDIVEQRISLTESTWKGSLQENFVWLSLQIGADS